MSKMVNLNKNFFSALRVKAGLNLNEVASLAGVSLRTAYRWENKQTRPKDKVFIMLKEMAENHSRLPEQPQNNFTFIDLFAGIGGMRLGFESIGGKCVFTSEKDKYCQETYLKNFPTEHPISGDITTTDIKDIPKHDVLLAGFPCQPFSIAGVSKKKAIGQPHGFKCKTQGTLFFDVARILYEHRPAAFLLENVKNLKTHDKGKTFQVIKDALDELGYYYDACVLDAKYWVPQHRERIFIAGFRETCDFSFNSLRDLDPTEGPKLGRVLHSEDGSEEPEPPFTEGPKAEVSSKYTLSDHLWEYLQQYAVKHKAKGNGFGFGLVGPNDTARTLSARYYKDGSEILVAQGKKNPRRLTPRECSRLMGFDRPDMPFKISVSDTQAYKQFGNAVVVPVVEAVAKEMLPHILYQKNLSVQLTINDAHPNETPAIA